MHHVKQYVKQNKKQLMQVFSTMGTDQTIEATKVYSFLQSAFDTQEIKLIKNGKSIFVEQENEQKMQALIEKYYLSKNQGETKFYMYRVAFEFSEVIDILKFWLSVDTSIQVMYKGVVDSKENSVENQVQNGINNVVDKIKSSVGLDQEDQSEKDENEFMPDIKNIPEIIKSYQDEVQKYEQTIQTQPLNETEIKNLREKIKQLQTKIQFLEQRLKTYNEKNNKIYEKQNKMQTQQKNSKNTAKLQTGQQTSSTSPKKSSLSPSKIDSTLKSIFEFYAKQLHVTGIKASFERIQHESSRINYQKLVHFLKEYNIFPPETKDQKKLHQFYVKCSSNTRDLIYEGFLSLLEKLAEILIPSQNENNSKFDLLKMKIIEQRRKNKVLNNPFHSLEKEDFRIDKTSLRYEFKLIPLNGKDPQQIVTQLEQRKQLKQQKRQQKQQQQMGKKLRYIKKLESIDPFHPLVQKNKHLIKQKNVMESEPIVSMDNIQMYRDKSFDLKLFGIEERSQGNSKNDSPTQKGNLPINNSYLIKNRVKQVEKLELDKMKNLMSGIIERSNAKLEKLGISPTKKASVH